MSDWLRDGLWIVVVPLSSVAVPAVMRRLPEPAPVELPEPGSAEETALHRALRAEGPKPLYAGLANKPRDWFLIMLLTGALGALAFEAFPARPAIAAAWLAPVFVLLWIVDWKTRLLPRVVVLPLTAVVAVLAVIDWIVRGDTDALIREASGGLIAWLFFGVLWFIRKAGMGFGDVRLALPIGILMAAVSWNAWLLGLYAAFVGFVVFAFAAVLIKRDRSVLKKAYPFGPFMIAGAYAGMALAPHLRLVG